MESGDVLYGLKHPKTILRQFNRMYFSWRGGEFNDGFSILDEDWDNLVILDACRYDTFAGRHSFDGDLGVRTSQGSNTYEFLHTNFYGQELYDTVYASSNLWYPRIKDDIDSDVYSFIPVTTEGPKNVVSPDAVTDRALEANQSHPNKRLIIHYTQPHYPYLGPTGREHFDHHETSSLQLAMRRNGDRISRDLVRRAYEENLDMVLEEVERLLPELRGKTVVTADHGEMLGERSFPIPITDYGHPNTIYIEELVKVPWLVINERPRKDISTEKPDADIDVSEEAIDENLRALGYKT